MIKNGVERITYTEDKIHILANKQDMLNKAYENLNKQGKRVINTSENMTYTGILANWIWEANITWEIDTDSVFYKKSTEILRLNDEKDKLIAYDNSYTNSINEIHRSINLLNLTDSDKKNNYIDNLRKDVHKEDLKANVSFFLSVVCFFALFILPYENHTLSIILGVIAVLGGAFFLVAGGILKNENKSAKERLNDLRVNSMMNKRELNSELEKNKEELKRLQILQRENNDKLNDINKQLEKMTKEV